MLGLSRKAGKLVSGFDATAEAAAKGQLHLIIAACDASPRTSRELGRIAEKENILFIAAPVTISEVGDKTGKPAAALGVADQGLAKAIEDLIRRADEEERIL